MKKGAHIIAAMLLSLCSAASLSAQDRPQKIDGWKFNVEPLFGARLGKIEEIVWDTKSTGGRYKLSQLDYDILPAWYIGANFGAQYKRFELNFLSKFFLSSKTGNLGDSDWRNDHKFQNGDTSTKTDFSRHPLFLKSNGSLPGYELELAAAFNFYPTSFLTLAPLLSFDAQYMSFKSKDGMGWYGDEDTTKNIIYPYVDANHRRIVNFANMDVLDYELYNLFIWTGLRADFIPASWAKISLASEVALFWTAIDFDHHITNNRYFIDISYSAFYAFRQTIKAEFKIKEFFSLCPKATFLLTAESAGPPYIKENNSTKYKKQSGGSGAQIICVDLELSAKFTW